jgi:hypothetical protein
MAKTPPYSLILAPVLKDHFRALGAKYDTLILDTIEQQLRHEPSVSTRNRKPVKQPAAFEAEWELRCGPQNRFRVFYQIDESARAVRIVAVGVKRGNELWVGDEKVSL